MNHTGFNSVYVDHDLDWVSHGWSWVPIHTLAVGRERIMDVKEASG